MTKICATCRYYSKPVCEMIGDLVKPISGCDYWEDNNDIDQSVKYIDEEIEHLKARLREVKHHKLSLLGNKSLKE